MQSRWNERDAAAHVEPVAECVYCTRLIGSDPALVLHGGGNSSVKAGYDDITGTTVPALYVKGSGWDMATIEARGLTALHLGRVRDLAALDAMSDPDMMRELDAARFDPTAPSPSVETLLHALLPFAAVQHSHADVIVTLTNVADGDAVVREVFGSRVVVVPYVMPGFDLARAVRESLSSELADDVPSSDLMGMVLLNHGLFTFGATSAEAYERHVELITVAERWLARHAPLRDQGEPTAPPTSTLVDDLVALRARISAAAGRPMVVQRHKDPSVLAFARRADVADLADRGPLTPDHVIRTKRAPMVGRDVDAFVAGYRAYVDAHRTRARTELTDLDPAPRVVIDPDFGMLTVGATAKDAQIAADIYHHTIPVLERAEDHLGGYRALPAADLFDMEYWVLEQAKLRRGGAPPELAGRVALVTGAASGIGRACAQELLARGACVSGLDRAGSVVDTFDGATWLGQVVDVTDASAQRDALVAVVERFGGIDIAVIGAGIFPPSMAIGDLDPTVWRDAMAVNLDAAADLMSALHPMLVHAPGGGRVVVIGSKNVPAPGQGAASYSASKAALTQLARIAALEWAPEGIRVNVVHPDAVFDTGLWTEDVIAERAARYGISVEEYKRRNLLGAEIGSADVAAVVTALCTDTFRVTTGAQISIDGGNERVV
jgi:rhamnose utilization protein RhaD (predicted bifunctional aldolase and dehydrogenase)/NAD(P)-dependent dehydrogenase (short-subunit alcohol dehydrogenase family)